MTTHTIRTGILGLGKMGIFHSSLVKMLPSAELIAVHDVNPKLAKYVKNAGIDVDFYSSLDDMLEKANLEAVFICTPPFSHLDLAEKCVEKGIHVFVEKPLAESLESAKKMVLLVKNNPIVHVTGYTIAHIPLFKEAYDLLQRHVLGDIYRFNISVYLSQVFSKKKGWFFDKKKSGGGVIIDIASHLLYLVVWYFGLPRSLYARTLSFFSKVEDSGTIFFECADNVQGVLDANWSLPGYRQSTTNLTIEGENGVMEVTNEYVKLYLHQNFQELQAGWTTRHRIDISTTAEFALGSDGFYDEDSHFIDCCLNGTHPTVTWRDGLNVQSMIDAIYRSNESKTPVTLDLD